jgi:hypothetical protein
MIPRGPRRLKRGASATTPLKRIEDDGPHAVVTLEAVGRSIGDSPLTALPALIAVKRAAPHSS